jgi:hypothetical protein
VRINVRDLLEINQLQTLSAGAQATGTLDLTANAGNNETVTIEGHVYTFKTALTGSEGDPDEVLIGATASDSIDNLIAAINNASGEGTTYGAGTEINQDVTAAAGAGDTMDVTCKYIGAAGNSVDTAESLANGSWTSGTTLGGGTNATGNMRFGFAYAHAAGSNSADQESFDLGHIQDEGVNVSFSGDHNPVTAVTKRIVTAYLTGNAEVQADFSMLGFAEENLAACIGQDESDVLGSGTTTAPYTLAVTADDINEDNDLSLRFTGARKDGGVVYLDLWATEMDFSAVTFEIRRGEPTPLAARAKATSGLRVSHYL